MNYMYSLSASSGGNTSLYVDFQLGTDANTDQILAQMRTAQANSQLPSQVTQQGVLVQPGTTAPFMLLDLYSPSGAYDNLFLANYATINLQYALTRVSGVGQVQIFGAGPYAMRIWVNPDRLASLGVTVPDITAAVQAQNKVNPAGQVGGEPVPPGQQFTYNVRAPGRLPTAAEFEQIIVRAQPDGSILRLKDVARVELGSQYYSAMARLGTAGSGKPTQPAALIALYLTPGSNALTTRAAVLKMMEDAKNRFPQGLDYIVALDTTLAVSSGIHEIYKTLFEALALVILVVFIFLQGWRATLIPLLAVPVSLIGTFMVFPLLGFSINTLSLFGLVLAIGLVVDDAIVVVEAVEHHIEQGMTPHDATVRAMEEVSGPVIAIALILAAVFIPTAFVPGITGQLYQQFAVTIAVSVIFSAFNALTLSPALSAMLLRPRKESRGPLGLFFGWFNRVFGRATDGYVGACKHLIHKAGFAFVLLGLLTLAAGFFGKKIPGSFLPDEDQGYVFAGLQLPDAASLQRSSEASRQVEKIIMDTPGVQYVSSVMGYSMLSGVNATYSSFFFVSFKPWDARKTAETSYLGIKTHLQRALSQVTSGLAFSFPPPAIPGVGTSGGATFILEDRSDAGVDFLAKNAQIFIAEARKRPELTGVMTTALFGVPQVGVKVDNAKVMTQQIQLSSLYETLQTFMGGALVNYFNRFGLQWQVYVQADGPLCQECRGRHGPVEHADQRLSTQWRRVHHALQPVQLCADQCIRRSRLQLRPGDAGAGGCLSQDHASPDGIRLHGHVVPGAKGGPGSQPRHHLRAGVLRGLPHHGSAIRKLDAALQRPAGRAHRGLRGLYHALPSPARRTCAGQRRIRADWPGDAHWAVGKECHPNRRVCQGRIRKGSVFARRLVGGCKVAAAPNPDDGLRLHSWLRAAVGGFRRRRNLAPGIGHDRHRRHAGLYAAGRFLCSRQFRCRGALWHLDIGREKRAAQGRTWTCTGGIWG